MRFIYVIAGICISLSGMLSVAEAAPSAQFDKRLKQQLDSAQVQSKPADSSVTSIAGGTMLAYLTLQNKDGQTVNTDKIAVAVAVGAHYFMVYTQLSPGERVTRIDLVDDKDKTHHFTHNDEWLYNYGFVWDTKTDGDNFCRNYDYQVCTDLVILVRVPSRLRFRMFSKPLAASYSEYTAGMLYYKMDADNNTLRACYSLPHQDNRCSLVGSKEILISEGPLENLVFYWNNDPPRGVPLKILKIRNVLLGFGREDGTFWGLGKAYQSVPYNMSQQVSMVTDAAHI